jgi:hypothetical protein
MCLFSRPAFESLSTLHCRELVFSGVQQVMRLAGSPFAESAPIHAEGSHDFVLTELGVAFAIATQTRFPSNPAVLIKGKRAMIGPPTLPRWPRTG